jgi:two-component system LytT family sensor kinase
MLFWPQPMYSRKLLARSLAVATAVGLVSWVRAIAALVSPGAYTSAGVSDLLLGILYLYSWAFQVPLLAPLFERYPLVARQWRRVAIYVAAGSMSALVPVVLNRALSYLATRLFAQSLERMNRSFLLEWFGGFLIFWIVATVFQAVEARQRVRELQGRLAQAELQNLKSQLQPHFLFNTLHTISVLIRQDPETANRVLLKLGDLLRISLDHSRADEIPLQQELDFLGTYLSIEQTRFQERLRTSITADGEARTALIPTLLLQPLVENAVRHGIAPGAAGGSLEISARRVSDTLELRIEDDGAGLPADYSERASRGCGIRNTVGRLSALYGQSARLEVAGRPGGGVAVSIFLPYRQS